MPAAEAFADHLCRRLVYQARELRLDPFRRPRSHSHEWPAYLPAWVTANSQRLHAARFTVWWLGGLELGVIQHLPCAVSFSG